MQRKQIFQCYAWLLAAGLATAVNAQPRPCSALPPEERAVARATGACRDTAPIVDVVPGGLPATDIAVANVVGLSFDEARSQLARFTVQRSYRASSEPGGTVLSQQPAAPARLAAGATVRLVLSDGTLRPPPSVPASQIDGVRADTAAQLVLPARPDPGHTQASTSAAPNSPVAGERAQVDDALQSKAPASRAAPAPDVRLRVPNVTGLSIAHAQSRLARFRLERVDRYSQAPAGRVIAQTPKASVRIAAGQTVSLIVSRGPEPVVTVTETFELPNVIDRSYADASSALVEFQINRVDVPNAAPSGTVLAQDPAPGAQVAPGGRVALQVSDGSLAAAAGESAAPVPTTPPAVADAPASADAAPAIAAAPAPAPNDPAPAVRLSNTLLTIGAAIFLGVVMLALLIRQWLARRQRELVAVTAAEPSPIAATIPAVAVVAPPIAFSARFDLGDVAIEFTGASDPEETTSEYSSAQHE